MSYMDFSSWPREQEQTFVVYEQHANESQKTAITAGIIVGLGVLVLMLGIYAGVEPDHRDLTKDMNMSNITKKQKPGDVAPTPAPSTAPAPAPTAPPATDKK
jgi:hypothetical protein